MNAVLRQLARISFSAPLTLSSPHFSTLTLLPTPRHHSSSNSTSNFPGVILPLFSRTSSTPSSGHTHTADDTTDIVVPDPPTDCCLSGCANCVWITYAAELAAIYKDGGKAAEKVMIAIDDPSLKIFLNLELKELLKETETDT